MSRAFPGLSFEEDTHIEEFDDSIIFLWEGLKPTYDLYLLIRLYLTENYFVDSALLLALIKDRGLELTETLEQIPFIHSGYVSKIIPEISSGSKEK